MDHPRILAKHGLKPLAFKVIHFGHIHKENCGDE